MARGTIVTLVALVSLTIAADVAAQGGDGGLRGTVKDNQGGVLPGVVITARSPDVLTPGTGVSDEAGIYRLVNLPPGTYSVTAELSGFSTFKRDSILLCARAPFQVRIA